MSLANGELGMSFLEQWFDAETQRRGRRLSTPPHDGASWLMYVLDFGKAGLIG